MKPTLVIMAAGMGSRYGGLKQIDPIGPAGEIIMDYSVYDAIRAGFGKVVFIIRPDIEQAFREKIGGKLEGKIPVEYAFQRLEDIPAPFTVPEGREKPWGTGQAILACKSAVNEPFAVINADDFYGAQAYEVLARELESFSADSTDSAMVGFEVANTLSAHGAVTRGVCEAQDGWLTQVVERMKIERNAEGVVQYLDGDEAVDMTGAELASMNFWGFTPQIFTALEEKFSAFLKESGTEMKSEFLIPTIVDEMIREGKTRVKVLRSADQWFGVTYPEDKPAVVASVKELVDAGKYPSPLWS